MLFADYSGEKWNWITAFDAKFYPDHFEAALAIYRPVIVVFRKLADEVADSEDLIRRIQRTKKAYRVQLLRIFRRYVSPVTSVEMLKKKGSTEEFSNETLLLSSSQAIVEEVAGNEAAIGYLGMGYTSERTKSLLVSKDGAGYPPNVENVKQKKYPLSRGLYFYTDGEPNGIKKLFLDFALGPKGQERFKATGFVPVGDSVVEKN